MSDTPKYLDSNPPRLSEAEAVAGLTEIFGRNGTASDIYRDQNFLIRLADGEKAILKVYNADELEASVDFQTRALSHLENRCRGVAFHLIRFFLTLCESSAVSDDVAMGEYAKEIEMVPRPGG